MSIELVLVVAVLGVLVLLASWGVGVVLYRLLRDVSAALEKNTQAFNQNTAMIQQWRADDNQTKQAVSTEIPLLVQTIREQMQDLQTWKAKQNALENHIDAILSRLSYFEKQQKRGCEDDEILGAV